MHVVDRLYTAFAQHDAQAMSACYHEDAQFEDPAFGQLDSAQVRAMWTMLIERSKGQLVITHETAHADEHKAHAVWAAQYHFGPKKRHVTNTISAHFKLKDGLIIQHKDNFDMWAWSRQALGLPGYLLGWSPMLQRQIQGRSRGMLDKYMRTES